MAISAGKVRGLTAASNEAGVFTILAVDHRDTMRAALDPDDPGGVSVPTMIETKLDLLAGIGGLASAVLLDPEYSALQAIGRRVLRGDVAFLCALEAQGYLGDPNARVTALLEGWSVEKSKRLGASGVKLLLAYRPDSDVADEQDAIVADVVAQCAEHDIALFLEPVSYELAAREEPGTAQVSGDRRRIVCESVRRLGALGPDILKVQFPVDTSGPPDPAEWADACAELNEASPVPWALLSGGDPFESFVEQVRVACEAGASGFLVGRALWGGLVRAPRERWPHLLDTVVRPKLAELSAIATESGADWASRYDLPSFGATGYRDF